MRKNCSEGVDGTIGLLKLDASVKQLNNDAVHVENPSMVSKEMEDQDLGHPLQHNPEENIENNRTRDYFTDHGPV